MFIICLFLGIFGAIGPDGMCPFQVRRSNPGKPQLLFIPFIFISYTFVLRDSAFGLSIFWRVRMTSMRRPE